MKSIIRGAVSLLGALVVLSCVAGPASARPPDQSLGPGGDRLMQVLAPARGSVVRTPVEIRIAFDPAADPATLVVVLNGHDITGFFGGLKDGVRRARLLPRDVREGQNQLSARVKAREGGGKDFDGVAFRANRALFAAEAGPGNVLQMALNTRVPAGSGIYKVQVGSTYYTPPSTSGSSLDGYHLLLLDRYDGAMLSNSFYPTSGSANEFLALTTAVKPATLAPHCASHGCLLVIQSQTTPGYADPSSNLPGSIFAGLGGTVTASYFVPGSQLAGYSLLVVIGPDGSPVGRAWERAGCQGGNALACVTQDGVVPPFTGDPVSPPGQISGYLVADNSSAYVFAYPGWMAIAFSTRHGATNQDGSYTPARPPGCAVGNVMLVGASTAGACLPSGATGGFQVVAVERSTGVILQNNVYALSDDGLNAMSQFLGGLTSNVLVLLSTVGQVQRLDAGYDQVGAILAAMGGTYAVFDALQSGDDYAFVGSPPPASVLGLPPTSAAEASSIITAATVTNAPRSPVAAIGGVLSPDARGYLWPSVAGPEVTFAPTRIDSTALLTPAGFPYPLPGQTGQANAYTWISYCLLYVTSGKCPAVPNGTVRTHCPPSGSPTFCGDIRASYNDASVENAWGSRATQLAKLAYPASAPSPPFTPEDFKAVKDQLILEFPLVGYVMGFLNVGPGSFNAFIDTTLSESNTSLTQVWNTVAGAFSSQHQKTPIIVDVVDAVAGLLTIVSTFELAGPAGMFLAGAVAAVLQTAVTIGSQDSSGAPMAQLDTTIASLAADSVITFAGTKAQVGRLFDLVLADWAKLLAVGAAVQAGLPGWTVDSGTAASLDTALYVSLQRRYFTDISAALWYVGHWPGVALGSPPSDIDKAICETTGQGNQNPSCFPGHIADHLKLLVPTGPAPGGVGQSYDAWEIGRPQHDPEGNLIFCNIGDTGPEGPLAQTMWGPLDLSDPIGGSGYGIYRPWFFMRSLPVLFALPIYGGGAAPVCQ